MLFSALFLFFDISETCQILYIKPTFVYIIFLNRLDGYALARGSVGHDIKKVIE